MIDDSVSNVTADGEGSSSHQDADGPATTSQKSPQRSSRNSEELDDVNGPLETIAGLMGK
jgi:hypothetical protein